MSSGPSGVTPIMVKIEVLDSELSEIDYRRFNFPWCTGYDPQDGTGGSYYMHLLLSTKEKIKR